MTKLPDGHLLFLTDEEFRDMAELVRYGWDTWNDPADRPEWIKRAMKEANVYDPYDL